MRSDSVEILAKIPSFILISSCFPFANVLRNPVYTKPGDDSGRILPEDTSIIPRIVDAFLRLPVAPSSPFNVPKRSIYKAPRPSIVATIFFFLLSFLHKGRISCRLRVPSYGHFADCTADRRAMLSFRSIAEQTVLFAEWEHFSDDECFLLVLLTL